MVKFSTRRDGPRSRWPIRPSARPAQGKVSRRVVRSAHRCALRSAARPVLKDLRPSLASLCAAFNRSYRELLAFHKKHNPPNRFKPLCSPEEQERRLREDLERAYGDEAMAARAAVEREQAARNAAAVASARPASTAPPARAHPPRSQSLDSHPNPPPLVHLLHNLFGM